MGFDLNNWFSLFILFFKEKKPKQKDSKDKKKDKKSKKKDRDENKGVGIWLFSKNSSPVLEVWPKTQKKKTQKGKKYEIVLNNGKNFLKNFYSLE